MPGFLVAVVGFLPSTGASLRGVASVIPPAANPAADAIPVAEAPPQRGNLLHLERPPVLRPSLLIFWPVSLAIPGNPGIPGNLVTLGLVK